MKSYYLSLIFTLVFSSVFAQDTIYMDKFYSDLDSKAGAKFYKIISKEDDKDQNFLRTTYYLNGQKKAEQYYRIKQGKPVFEGLHKHFYESGDIFYQIPYQHGKIDGNLIAYWENGEKRRHDVFKKDKLKEGRVWNKNGKELDYFEHHIPASFPGGKEKLYAYLKENINIPEEHKKGTRAMVVLRFTLNTEGELTEIQIVEGAPPQYNAEAIRVLSEMPQWIPTKRFGEAINSRYTLPIVFYK